MFGDRGEWRTGSRSGASSDRYGEAGPSPARRRPEGRGLPPQNARWTSGSDARRARRARSRGIRTTRRPAQESAGRRNRRGRPRGTPLAREPAAGSRRSTRHDRKPGRWSNRRVARLRPWSRRPRRFPPSTPSPRSPERRLGEYRDEDGFRASWCIKCRLQSGRGQARLRFGTRPPPPGSTAQSPLFDYLPKPTPPPCRCQPRVHRTGVCRPRRLRGGE